MRRTVTGLAVIIVAAALVWGPAASAGLVPAPSRLLNGAATPSTSTGPGTPANDYYTVQGRARHPYTPKRAGEVEYCSLDRLNRPVCAYGELTVDLRHRAQERGRQKIDVDPPGWGHNREVDIPATAVTGSRPYHGYLFNRSHLVADSLGGAPSRANIITGTRTQNVGSTQVDGQYAGGMAHTETLARDYLTHDRVRNCPLYYAATANYTGSELVPRTVTIDIASCNRTVDEHVVVPNTAAGFTIDYATGTWQADH